MMFRRHRTAITFEGWLYVLVLAFVATGSVLREINLLMLMAGLMLGPFLIGWRMAVAAVRPLSVRRHAPEAVGAGETLVVDLTLSSRPSRWPRFALGAWGIVVEDDLRSVQGAAARINPRALFWHVARGESQRLSYRGQLIRRGRYQFGRLTISTRYPLGLLRRTMFVDAPRELTVLPRMGHLTPAWERLYRQAVYGANRRQAPLAGLEGDFHSLREWRPGDAQRQIHWRTTARRRLPVVRRLEQPNRRELALIVDLHRPVAGGTTKAAHKEEHIEQAVSFAATIINDACRYAGTRLLMGLAGNSRQLVQGMASAALRTQCLSELAVLEPGDGHHFMPLVRDCLAELPSGTGLIVLTTRAEEFGRDGTLAGWDEVGVGRRGPVLVIDAVGPQRDEYFSSESTLAGSAGVRA